MGRLRGRLRLKRVELLDVRCGLSGELLIQQEILLPEKVNLSLGLDLLLLDRMEGRITATDETSHAMMLRSRTCLRSLLQRWINLPLRSGPSAEVPVRIHGRPRRPQRTYKPKQPYKLKEQPNGLITCASTQR